MPEPLAGRHGPPGAGAGPVAAGAVLAAAVQRSGEFGGPEGEPERHMGRDQPRGQHRSGDRDAGGVLEARSPVPPVPNSVADRAGPSDRQRRASGVPVPDGGFLGYSLRPARCRRGGIAAGGCGPRGGGDGSPVFLLWRHSGGTGGERTSPAARGNSGGSAHPRSAAPGGELEAAA